MTIEVLLALLTNLKEFFVPVAFVGLVGALFCTVAHHFCEQDARRRELKQSQDSWDKSEIASSRAWAEVWTKLRKISVIILIVTGPVTIIPSLKDLWEVRIALIKLELSSPENVKRGAEEIGRIAKKLECKYLGCNEDSKQPNKE